MLKKTITFDDLDGNKVTEDFYFNISKAELAELEIVNMTDGGKSGGYAKKLEQVAAAKNGQEMVDVFKDILRMSVGRRSEDGRRFVKSQDIADEFFQTDAYSVMFMELFTNTEAAVAFFKAIVPGDLQEGIDEAVANTVSAENVELPPLDTPPGPVEDTRPAWVREDRDPTSSELQNMTPEQLKDAFRRKASRE